MTQNNHQQVEEGRGEMGNRVWLVQIQIQTVVVEGKVGLNHPQRREQRWGSRSNYNSGNKVSEAAKTSLQNKDGVGESKRKGRKEGEGEERDERVRIRVYINWMREGERVCEWTSRKSTS